MSKPSLIQEKVLTFFEASPNQWFSVKEVCEQAFVDTRSNQSRILISLHEITRKYENLVAKKKSKLIAGTNRKVWHFKWKKESGEEKSA